MVHSASTSFVWDNMYQYDKDFRMHMERHPQRSCSLILQQAWLFRLRDRHGTRGESTTSHSNNHANNNKYGKKEPCWRYNQGHCTYGNKCKFEHKCVVCGKFGHGAFNCGKANYKSDKRTSNEHQDNHPKKN